KKTGEPIAGRMVGVRYIWLWLEYPYPEHPSGAWSEAYEFIECVSGNDGKVEVPEHEVVPRGWYKGKYSASHEPRFNHLEVQVLLEKHIQSFRFQRSEIERIRSGKESEIILSVSKESPL